MYKCLIAIALGASVCTAIASRATALTSPQVVVSGSVHIVVPKLGQPVPRPGQPGPDPAYSTGWSRSQSNFTTPRLPGNGRLFLNPQPLPP